MRIVLHNDFHNSSVALNADIRSHIHNVATAYLTRSQIKRAKRELFGIAGCTCSGDCGTRGQQVVNGKRLEINCDAAYKL